MDNVVITGGTNDGKYFVVAFTIVDEVLNPIDLQVVVERIESKEQSDES